MTIHDDLAELQKDNQARLQALANMGTKVDGLAQLYMNTLLEYLLGDDLPFAQMNHERKVSVQLDNIESASVQARLLMGVRQQNGKPAAL